MLLCYGCFTTYTGQAIKFLIYDQKVPPLITLLLTLWVHQNLEFRIPYIFLDLAWHAHECGWLGLIFLLSKRLLGGTTGRGGGGRDFFNERMFAFKSVDI